jgi:hypothetical protein
MIAKNRVTKEAFLAAYEARLRGLVGTHDAHLPGFLAQVRAAIFSRARRGTWVPVTDTAHAAWRDAGGTGEISLDRLRRLPDGAPPAHATLNVED